VEDALTHIILEINTLTANLLNAGSIHARHSGSIAEQLMTLLEPKLIEPIEAEPQND
jgi:hypothetical protein